MRAHNVGPFAFIFSLALTGPASAGALDDAHVLVGLERTTGVAFSHAEISYGGISVTTDQTDGTLLWSQGGAAPYSMPRFAFDVVVSGAFTFGGSAGYGWHTASLRGSDGSSTDQPSVSTFAVAPRIGVLCPVSASMYFWPRVGATYSSQSIESH